MSAPFAYDLPPELTVEVDGPVRTVVMRRPAALNAMNAPLHWAMANVWRQLAADDGARVVILTGEGRAFSAGGDLDWITSFLDDRAARDESVREGAQILEEIIRFPLPVIAAVNGLAIGLGATVAVMCDIVLMGEHAALADPHVSVGLVAGDGGAAFWPRLAPINRIREYLFTGERINAALAVELGLATRVVADDALVAEATALAGRIAEQPPAAVQGTKKVLNLHLAQALSGAVQAGFEAELATMQTDEHRRRIEALRSKSALSMAHAASELDDFRADVAAWCVAHVPADWRSTQTGASEEEFVRFQKAWFAELHSAGYAVPHWPAEWGGGMSTAEQVVLFQELAAHDAPRLVLAFVSIHHAASTLLAFGTDEQRRRHLPAILEGEIWCQGFSEPDAGSDLASLSTSARRMDDGWVVNGQKVWASGAMDADWCLLLARTDPDAAKRRGISYFLMDMRSPGLDVRRITQATGEAHFCEMFLDDVHVPTANLVGDEHAGWQVAQATLGAERGLTMLELAERLANGFRWLLDTCAQPGPDGTRPLDDARVLDRLASFATEITALRSMCTGVVERVEAGAAGPADASVVKLFYSELLQRLTGFGAEVVGLAAHTELHKPLSSGWESGRWMLDFISSWEWTIPGGTSEIQRNIIGERGLGLPREPLVP